MSTLRAMIREMQDAFEEDDSTETFVEDGSDLDEGLSDLADLMEEAGYEVPETIEDVEGFLAAVESDVLSGDELDEKLGQKIKAAWHKAKKAVHGFMKKHRQNKAMRQSGKALGHAFKKWDKAHPAH